MQTTQDSYRQNYIFSSQEPKIQGELIVLDSSRRLSVRASTLSNMNISETSWPIVIKFHLEHQWGRGLTALVFGENRIRTLVSMATDNGGNLVTTLAPSFLIVFSLFLQETRTTIIFRMGSKFGRI